MIFIMNFDMCHNLTVICSGQGLLIEIFYIYIYIAFLWDMNNTKWCNGFYIQFRQNFAKETFSYGEHLKS